MKEEKVNFPDKQGRNIVGTLYLPDGNGPFPAVVLCHGFKGSKNQEHIKAIATEIAKKQIAVLTFDFTKDPGESSLPFEEMTVSYELEVLDQAFTFIKNHPQIDTNKIGISGHSLGGLVVSWYSATHPEIKALVPLSAVYGFLTMWKNMYGEEIVKEMHEKGFSFVFSKHLNKKLRINKEFYDDAANYDMDQMVGNLECPILVVCGTDDKLLVHAQHYFDRVNVQDKELKIIKSADHNYTNPENLEEVKTAVAAFFAKTLK